jgi:AcrR family transcriptional regulator
MPDTSAMVKKAGRARDASIDERVLQIAGRHLAEQGFDAMSVSAVAREAGTTRQAVYRRWPSKTDLAAAVVGGISSEPPSAPLPERPSPFVDPFGDLVAELTDFARGVSGPGRLFLVGTMLQDNTDPTVQEQYRAHVVAPRRQRIRAILQQAVALELIDADADLEVAVTLGTGSWYARALAGDPVPPDWPARTAALVWRAVGGDPQA